MSTTSRYYTVGLTLYVVCVFLLSCGGGADRVISSLDQSSATQSNTVSPPAYGTTLKYDPNSPPLSHTPPSDPWALPDLDLKIRNVLTSSGTPSLEQMQARLEDEFYRIGKDPSRVVATVPGGNDNTVFDLVAEPFGSPITGVSLTWTERIIGDFDQNSEVNIADLTPIAVNFGSTPNYDPESSHGGIDYWPAGDPDGAGAANWRLAVVDGDSNGEVNLADISGIAVHFKERLDGYRIYRRLDGEGTFTMVESIADPGASYTIGRPDPVANAPVRYQFNDTAATSGNVEYYVAAYDMVESEEGGQSNTASVQLSQGPTADLNVDVTEGTVPLMVNFDAGNSLDPDGTIDNYEFDFGEGSGFEDFDAVSTASYEYTELGLFTASVRVTDNQGNTDVAARVINTSGTEPIALLHLDIDFGETPLTVNFDATLSSDPDGTIDTYEFDFGAGAGFVDMGTTNPQFAFINSGTVTVRLRVTDNHGLQNIYSRDITTFNPGELVLPPLWEIAKANAGVSGSTMGAEEILPEIAGLYNGWIWGGGPWTDQLNMLPSFWEAWFNDVEGYPDFLTNKSQGIYNASGLQEQFLEANKEALLAYQINPQSHSSNLDPTDPLATALFNLATAAGGIPDLAAIKAAVVGLSLDDRQALAELVDATQQAMELRESTVLPFFLFDDMGYAFMEVVFDGAHGAGSGGLWALRVDDALMFWNMYVPDLIGVRLFSQFPFSGIYEGTALMADAVDNFSAYLATSPTFGAVSVEIDTPLGRITIGGTGDDNHLTPPDENGHILLIDLGGNDTYDCHAGANASEANGTSICLDLGGDDTYNALDDPNDFDRSVGYSDDNTAQQGTGRMGIGMLVDFSGVDSYTGVRMAQGGAVFGAGILADFGGSGDTYSFEALGQGGAIAGIGLLYDDGGADNYTCYSMAQGFGGISGIGYLVDAGMDSDTYLAIVDEDITKPEYFYRDEGQPVYGTNSSIAQGAAWGARWGWIVITDGEGGQWNVLASGGQGLLYDEGGSDSYTCGTFGQGFGLYEGMGVLMDLEGDDVHNGHWYTQGAARNAGQGAVIDFRGDDTWDNEVSIGIGGAEDLSVSWFFDIFGNDVYNASDYALGTGLNSGFGYFLDYFGDDTYNPAYATPAMDNLGIGRIDGFGSPQNPSYGIFVDTHGTDIYDPGYQGMLNSVGLPGDEQEWTRVIDFASDPPDPENDKQGHGAGVDGPLLPK